MNNSLHIFQKFNTNTDAIPTNKGFFYQNLLSLNDLLKIYITKNCSEIYCETEDDIKNVNTEDNKITFTQVKAYSNNLTLNSQEMKKAIINFFQLYIKYKEKEIDTDYIFTTTSNLNGRFFEKLKSSNYVLKDDIKKEAIIDIEILLKKEYEIKNDTFEKNFNKKIKERLDYLNKYPNPKKNQRNKHKRYKEELKLFKKKKKEIEENINEINEIINTEVPYFINKITWDVKNIDIDKAIDIINNEIIDKISKIDYCKNSIEESYNYLLVEVVKASQSKDKTKRVLSNKTIEDLIQKLKNNEDIKSLYINTEIIKAFKKTYKKFNELESKINKVEQEQINLKKSIDLMNNEKIIEINFEWLTNEFNKSKASMDQRYTPNQHIDTKLEYKLNAFILSENFKKQFITNINKIVELVRSLKLIINEQEKEELKKINDIISSNYILNNVDYNKLPSFSKISFSFQEILDFTNSLLNRYKKNQDNVYKIHQIEQIISSLLKTNHFLNEYNLYEKQFLLVQGPAGVGKSHTLTHICEQINFHEQNAILFIGEQFINQKLPQEQIVNLLDWNRNFENLLNTFEKNAIKLNRPSIIIIDAINESNYPKIWNTQLNSIIEIIKNYKHIKLIISCRSDFSELVIPSSILKNTNKDFSIIYHSGYDLKLSEAIRSYFKAYNIRNAQFPPLSSEFKNPLFLKTFCETFSNKEIPLGPISFSQLMEERIKQCKEELYKRINCPSINVDIAISYISKKIVKNDGNAVPSDKIQKKLFKIYNSGESDSLYRHLKSNGIITELPGTNCNKLVRFPFQMFSDYFIATRLLEKCKTINDVKIIIDKLLNSPNNNQSYKRGIIRMLSIIIPEKFRVEFLSFCNPKDKLVYAKDFIESLTWRSNNSITDNTIKLMEKYTTFLTDAHLLNNLIQLSTIPNHTFNANWLDSKLKKLSLSDKDLYWTIPISNLTENNDENNINVLLNWVFDNSNDLISNEQAWLITICLTWILSSNNKLLRYRVSIALIKLLKNRIELLIKMIQFFVDCNDPYIIERVYGITCGIILRENNLDNISAICDMIYEDFFSKEIIPTNILQREYAIQIINYGILKNAISTKIDISKCSPPFKSSELIIPQKSDLENINKNEFWVRINNSLKPEKAHNYGDFGRYVMDYDVHKFSNQKLNKKYIKGTKYSDTFDGDKAKAFIQKRIEVLGWSNKFFEYDKRQYTGRQNGQAEEIKIERIGKKYQWIALYELLGFLSDNYWMHSQNDNGIICDSAQYFDLSSFDPTQPIIDPQELIEDNNYSLNSNKIVSKERTKLFSIDDNFSNIELLSNREKWVLTPPNDYSNIININFKGKDYLTLSTHLEQKENLLINQDEKVLGKCSLWIDMRCWIIKKKDIPKFIKYCNSEEFYNKGLSNIDIHNIWLGTYPWNKECDFIKQINRPAWIENSPVNVYPTTIEYLNGNYLHGKIPSPLLIDILNISWDGYSFNYIDEQSNILITSYIDNSDNLSLLVDKNKIVSKFNESQYSLIWASLSEKSCYSRPISTSIVKKWGINQRVYILNNNQIKKLHDKNYDIDLKR